MRSNGLSFALCCFLFIVSCFEKQKMETGKMWTGTRSWDSQRPPEEQLFTYRSWGKMKSYCFTSAWAKLFAVGWRSTFVTVSAKCQHRLHYSRHRTKRTASLHLEFQPRRLCPKTRQDEIFIRCSGNSSCSELWWSQTTAEHFCFM